MPKTGTLLLILAYLVAAAASWHRLAHSPEAAAFLTAVLRAGGQSG